MWKRINSPIAVTIIAVVSLFLLRATMKPRLAGEIRGVYEELTAIIEDGAPDAEKSKAIRTFAQEIGTQIREGFAAGFKSNDSGKEDKDKDYLSAKDKIDIYALKFVRSRWPEREKFIFVLKNNSDKYISNLRLNYEFYRNGEIIDCENKWISEIKLLAPNQEIAISEDRSLPKEKADDYKSDEVKVKITSFVVKQITKCEVIQGE